MVGNGLVFAHLERESVPDVLEDRRRYLNVWEFVVVTMDAGCVFGVGNLWSVGCGVDVEGLCCFEYSG